MENTQIRQGDVLLEKVLKLPANLNRLDRKVVAYGEATGHAHRFDCKLADDVTLYEDSKGQIWIKVATATPLTHEEHPTHVIEPGAYLYIPQRTYTPEGIRRVVD